MVSDQQWLEHMAERFPNRLRDQYFLYIVPEWPDRLRNICLGSQLINQSFVVFLTQKHVCLGCSPLTMKCNYSLREE